MKIQAHWSYTAASLFKCKRLYKEVYIKGNRAPQGPSATRGEQIHKLAEHYLKGDITGGVPGALRKLEAEFRGLKKAQPVVEEFWGVDEDWHFVRGRGWCVMKMDAAVEPTWKQPTLDMIDFKTGQIYPTHEAQGELYLAIGFARTSWIEEASTEFWYTDQGKVVRREYTRSDIKTLAEKWHGKGREIMTTTKFPATPHIDVCRWCHIRSDRGGNCDRYLEVMD